MREKLKDFPLFSSVGFGSLEALTRGLPETEFKVGQTLMQQGQKGTRALLLFDGRVAVEAESKEGGRANIVFQSAPSIFGVIELWNEAPYLASVVAMEPCLALVLEKTDYFKMLQSNHQVCINMVQLLSQMFYQAGRDRHVRLFGKVENLVANTLCYFAQLYGEEHRYGILIRKTINKSQMAVMLGVARRSVIRALDALEKEKLIEVQDNQWVIPDIAELKKKASS
jgi:CRP/FNR family transcriptional regulator